MQDFGRQQIIETLSEFAKKVTDGRASVQIERVEGQDGTVIFELLIRPENPDAISVGVIADEDWMILHVRGRRGWEPSYDAEGIEFVMSVIEGAARGEVARELWGSRRSYPAY